MGCMFAKVDEDQTEAASHVRQLQIGSKDQNSAPQCQDTGGKLLNNRVNSEIVQANEDQTGESGGTTKGKERQPVPESDLEQTGSTASFKDHLFEFTALKHSDTIRLLILEPAEDRDSELRGYLEEVKLEDDPAYEAISYVWGEPKFPQELRFPAGKLSITENLSNALRHFRLHDAPRALWTDAVCINQKNDLEKGHQVRLMAKIYKKAIRVLIWLGEETCDTTKAIETFHSIADSHGYSAIEDPIDQHWWRTAPVVKAQIKDASEVVRRAKESSIQDLYTREWFERLWIVQEVALAKKAILHCGSQRLDWVPFASAMTFLAAAETLTPKLDEPEAFKRVINIINIRSHYGDINEIQPSLIVSNYHHFGVYMYKLRHQKCADDRDRVYALLGLRPFWCEIPGNKLLSIEPDYGKPAFEVYRHWAGEMMTTGECNFMLDAGIYQRRVHITTGDMEFYNGDDKWKKGFWVKIDANSNDNNSSELIALARVIRSGDSPPSAKSIVIPSIQELPSWVPDLSNYAKTYNSVPWTNRHGFQGFEARSNHEFGDSLQFVKWESGDEVPRQIWVKALLLDKISSTMGIHEWNDSLDCSRMGYLRQVVENCHFFFQRFGRREGEDWPIDEDPETAFARTIFADGSGVNFQSLFNPANESQAHSLSKQIDPKRFLELWKDYRVFWDQFDRLQKDVGSFDELSPTMQNVFGILTSFYSCFSEILEGHMFFNTDRRFIGLAPLVSKSGDQIALIDSLRTPVVLRSITTVTGDNGYILVGPCYVQGVMYGETQKDSGSKLAKEGEYIPLL